MLVISAYRNERVVIRPNVSDVPDAAPVEIWVTVVEVGRGRKVRLGFEAPRDVGIFREKVYQGIFGAAPAVQERPAACPVLPRIVDYARAVTGFEEPKQDDPDVRRHLGSCGGCCEDLRRKIPRG